MIGLVVNPRLNEPLLVTTDLEFVAIRSLSEGDFLFKHGAGYPSDQREKAADATGYPRVHTPHGVKPTGKGYGTSLYSALCMGAYLTNHELVEIGMKVHGDGISSAEADRSREADAWWDAALGRGLTEKDVTEDTEKEENVEIGRDVGPSDINVSVDGEIVYVNSVDVDIEKTVEERFDYYTHDSMTDHDLSVAEFAVEIPRGLNGPDSTEFLWRAIVEDPGLIYQTFDVPLLGIDVRGLDESFINLLSLLYLHAGLKDQDVDSLRERWRYGLDPGHISAQQQLFRANASGMANVQWARERANWDALRSLP